MLKSVLYGLLLATTTLRLADMIFLIVKGNSNLPVAVFAVTGVIVAYGLLLLAKRINGNVTVKQFTLFFSLQAAAIIFNLSYVAVVCPLSISVMETIAVGTFLDILIDLGAVYFCAKQIRSHYFEVQPVMSASRNV